MYSKIYSVIITFPFEQLGLGLRTLSLSSAAGNITAIFIYILICLIPCLFFFRLKKSKKLLKTDYILPVLSILLFAVIYYMINPGLFRVNIPELLRASIPGAGKFLLGSAFYSVFFGYIILRILEKCNQSDTAHLHAWLKSLFATAIFLFLYAIFEECFESLSVSIQYLQDANSIENIDLTITYVFLILQCMINILPHALAVVILFTAVRFMNALILDRYSDASVAAAEKLVSLCTKSLVIAVLSGMIFNILQLLFFQMLHQINMVVTIPVFSIAFVLAVSLTASYIRENQKLKQDNDLFI